MVWAKMVNPDASAPASASGSSSTPRKKTRAMEVFCWEKHRSNERFSSTPGLMNELGIRV